MILAHAEQLTALPPNMRFLTLELLRRGVHIDWPVSNSATFIATLGDHVEFFQDICPLKTSYPSVQLFSHKQATRHVLKSVGISVVDGQSFTFRERLDALSYFKSLKDTVVVKPTLGIEGEGVQAGLTRIEEVDAAIYEIRSRFPQYEEFVIERYFLGQECRIFMTEDGHHAAVLREPAAVMGDGKSTITDLARRESERRTNPRTNCLGPIPLDHVVDGFLQRSGRTIDDIPVAGERVYLRDNSNLKTGGMARDITDEIHPSVFHICRDVLSATRGLPFVGIDYISRDLFKQQSQETYAIIEVNPVPGIGMHLAPGEGKARPVDKIIVDLVFPETKSG